MAPPTEPVLPNSCPDPFTPVPRAVYVTKSMLEKHGFTVNCGKCKAIQRNLSQTTLGYTSDCRKHMEKLLGNDMEHLHRLEPANDRANRHLAEELEKLEAEPYLFEDGYP